MSQKRKWSPSQKFEIALLALKNETTINDICKKYEVAPCQVHEWKKQLLEQRNVPSDLRQNFPAYLVVTQFDLRYSAP